MTLSSFISLLSDKIPSPPSIVTKSSTLSLLFLYCRPFLLSWPRPWFNDHSTWSTPGFYLSYLPSSILILSPLRSTAPTTLLELKVRSLPVLLYMNRSGDFKVSTQLEATWRTTTCPLFLCFPPVTCCANSNTFVSRSGLISSTVFTVKAQRSHPLRSTCEQEPLNKQG